MNLIPRFTPARRALQLGWFGVRHGTEVFEKLNRKNLFLAKQFSNREIFCNVCGKQSKLWFEMHSTRTLDEHKVSYLRETLECMNCLSRTRYRIMAFGLLDECAKRFGIEAPSLTSVAGRIGHIDILDTDAFSPAVPILQASPGYKISKYIPNAPAGLQPGGNLYNVDLQAIPFADCSFDMLLSSDVMEHVRRFEQANREIFRCLKPGGVHIFTVPFHDPAPMTRTLVDTSTDEDIYLEPPQLHGDDHFTGKIPAYRIYGMDLLDKLRGLGFEAEIVRINAAANGIYDECYLTARRPK